MHPAPLNPERLPRGTRVGPWRVLERRGLGAYGAVYRASGPRAPSGFVALKLALHPRDERFAREVELLSRIRHPNVPRLVDQGVWQPSSGLDFPYLAMELVEGVSLYEWAREQQPTSRRVLHVLASLARALAATHAASGVHRDVKGDNVLVSDAEGRAFLTDFGSGHYLGAATLTQPPFPPGTPAYRSPEAWRSVRLPMREPIVPYAPGPADDVYALGVTAFRLVTDEYPFPSEAASHPGQVDDAGAPSARALNPRCCQELSDLTSRMLSFRPEVRGSARELAEALEQAARHTGPEADVALFGREAPRPGESRAEPRPLLRRAPKRSMPAWLSAASLAGALALGAGWMLRARPRAESEQEHASRAEASKDGGTVAVGDTALSAHEPVSQAPFAWSTIAEDMPPRPFRSQRRPDANGRCPKPQVPIHGGCWIKLTIELKDCVEDLYVYKGACYTPAMTRERPATSSPASRAGDAGTEH